MAKRKVSTQSKAAEILAKIAASTGGQMDMSVLTKLAARSESTVVQQGADREAESVMRSLHMPHAYMIKKCRRKSCGELFQTNYCSVGYCSSVCITADFKEIGINYDPYRMKPWETSMFSSSSGMIYRYEPPEYIPTEVLDDLEIYATKLLVDLARLREKAVEVESLQDQKKLEEVLNSLHDENLDQVDPESLTSPVPLDEQKHEEDYDSLTNLFGVLPKQVQLLDFF